MLLSGLCLCGRAGKFPIRLIMLLICIPSVVCWLADMTIYLTLTKVTNAKSLVSAKLQTAESS